MESASTPQEAETDTGLAVGVIGTGNMGSSLVRGWSRALGDRTRLLVWDKMASATDRVAGLEGVDVAGSLEQLVREADIVVIVVKPKDGDGLLRSIAGSLRRDHVVVSAMAGVDLRQIRAAAGPVPRLFRVMPNLGVEVGAGVVGVAAEEPPVTQPVPRSPEAVSAGDLANRQAGEALDRVAALFDALGLAVVVPEAMMDTVTAVSGTGPALLALALEALEDGGVAAGLPRPTVRAFARRTMLGAARMLVAGEGPAGELRDRLIPEGDVLQGGLEVLRERGVRTAFHEAVVAAAQRSRDMKARSGAG